MSDAVITLIAIVGGIVVGWYAAMAYHIHMFNKAISHIREMRDQQIVEDEINHIGIRIEEHDGVLFIYKTDDSSYMAHGKDETQVLAELVSKYPNTQFVADDDSIEILKKRSTNVTI